MCVCVCVSVPSCLLRSKACFKNCLLHSQSGCNKSHWNAKKVAKERTERETKKKEEKNITESLTEPLINASANIRTHWIPLPASVYLSQPQPQPQSHSQSQCQVYIKSEHQLRQLRCVLPYGVGRASFCLPHSVQHNMAADRSGVCMWAGAKGWHGHVYYLVSSILSDLSECMNDYAHSCTE